MANEILGPPRHSETYRRLLYTIGILLAYRLGCEIPVPALNTEVWSRLDGALKTETMSIFALGVTPFLSALLIFEFIKLLVPPLARWETADPDHARRLSRYSYFLALIMAGLQANGLANALYGITGLIDGPGWETIIAVTLIAGTMLLGWFGDRTTVRGLGNGFWLLLITPTLVGLPSAALVGVEALQRGAVTPTAFFAAVVFLVVAAALAAAACLAGARPEHRVSGAGFAGVWPPLFASYISGFVVAFFSIAAGGAIHLILIAALIAMFNWLQSLGLSKEAARPIWTIALLQILICCGGELLTHHMNPPFAINGSWLIVVVTTAMSFLRGKELTA